MYISPVNVYSSVNYCGGRKLDPCVIKKAEEELKLIKSEGKVAGTDSAWWRYGYNEAVQSLQNIAAGKESVEPKNYESPLARFLSNDDDGFI
ncbi:MAG: hypothetical protein MJ230_07985 [bacterium]|nr:hypothetical protein [bacterium]